MTQQRGSTHRSHSADEALARIDRGIEEAASRATQSQEFVNSYAALEGAGTSPDGDVRVTLGPEGLLTRLTITDTAASTSGASVRAAILAANAAGIADLRHRATDLTNQTWGAGSATADAVVTELPGSRPPHPDTPGPAGPAGTGRSAW